MAVTSTMFLKSRQKCTLLGQEANRTTASKVNHSVQIVSMTKNGSRKLGAAPSKQCVIENIGRVSTQKSTMETNVMATEMTAITNPDRDVSGYSNSIHILRIVLFAGRFISSDAYTYDRLYSSECLCSSTASFSSS